MKKIIVLSLFASLVASAEILPVISYSNDPALAKSQIGMLCEGSETSNLGKNYGFGKIVGSTKCWDTTKNSAFNVNYICSSACDRPVVK